MKEKPIPGQPLTTKEKSRMCLYERMSYYQDQEKDQAFNPSNSVLLVRVSFKNIRRFSKVFEQPFDTAGFDLIQQTATYLLNTFKAKYAHVGVGEITLVLHGTEKTPLDYGGKKQKLVSAITSAAASHFSLKLANSNDIDDLYDRGIYPTFDVTIFRVPNRTETGNALLWAERENTKKCIIAISSHLGISKDIDNKTFVERIRIIKEVHKFDWDNVDSKFKNGIYIKRKKVHLEGEEFSRYITEVQPESFTNSSIDERNKRIFI
ncbi:MAG: tRNA(His) guanylyltransferase Thg1 family protein [Aurantimicrobium sp.]|uniref:tRNA(His) guanylyltransferase Thg1 family protein n=1 Tax=Aurantimicrobium sp. TaxID=1930784 RepID=UPI002FC825C4